MQRPARRRLRPRCGGMVRTVNPEMSVVSISITGTRMLPFAVGHAGSDSLRRSLKPVNRSGSEEYVYLCGRKLACVARLIEPR